MKKKTIFEIYDKLKPYMIESELKDICKDLILSKPIFEYLDGDSYNFNKKVAKKVVVLFGEREFKSFFNQEMPERYNDILAVSMQPGNVIYLTDKVIEDALYNDKIGQFLFVFTHELEHIYRYYIRKKNNKIGSENNLENTKLTEEGFNYLKEMYGETIAVHLDYFITKLTASYINYTYQDCNEEFFANAMASLYFKYNLDNYIKIQTDEKRKDWLIEQKNQMFAIQTKINETLIYSTESKNKVDKNVVKKQLNYLLDAYSSKIEECTKNVFKMCKELDFISEEYFQESLQHIKKIKNNKKTNQIKNENNENCFE